MLTEKRRHLAGKFKRDPPEKLRIVLCPKKQPRLHLAARWSRKPADDAALLGAQTPAPAPPGVGY